MRKSNFWLVLGAALVLMVSCSTAGGSSKDDDNAGTGNGGSGSSGFEIGSDYTKATIADFDTTDWLIGTWKVSYYFPEGTESYSSSVERMYGDKTITEANASSETADIKNLLQHPEQVEVYIHSSKKIMAIKAHYPGTDPLYYYVIYTKQ